MKESMSINRIQNGSFVNDDMARLAIRGEMNWGQYLRDMGVGAAAGAASGAVVAPGAGAIPGAIGGAAYGLGSNLVTDIAYQIYGNEDKAAWQAGDLQERLNKMGDWFAAKTQSNEYGQFLKNIGAQYKNYIDVAISQKEDDDSKKTYEQNMFNPGTQQYQDYIRMLTSQDKKLKFVRIANDNGAVGMAGGAAGNIAADAITMTVGRDGQYYVPGDPALNPRGFDKLKDAIKPGNLAKGLKGGLVFMGVDMGLNWGLDKLDQLITGDEIAMFKRELGDVKKIITEINRLTENDTNVVYAGNMLWTALDKINSIMNAVEQYKTQNASQQQINPGLPLNVPNNTNVA